MKEFFYQATIFLVAFLLLMVYTTPVRALGLDLNDDEPIPSTTDTPVTQPAQDPAPDQQVVSEALLLAPSVNVWYESSLRFGHLGNPQRQINIPGNISESASLQSVQYTLNGGSPVTLLLGTSGSVRLIRPGDFNIAINTTSLISGQNTVVITGRDSSGAVVLTKTIRFNYTPNVTWRIPYSTNWAAAASIQDQAQVVDGLWAISGGGLRIQQVGYDRVVAIGDIGWRDYEVLVPITIHNFPIVDEGGVGIIAHWQGHTGGGSLPSLWSVMGAYGYLTNKYGGPNGGLALRLDDRSPAAESFNIVLNKTYLMKLRVETVPTGESYSLKVWEKGQPEPAWNTNSRLVNVVDTTGNLPTGSMLLVAHHADATFGDVTVCPFNVNYTLRVNVNGGGTVTTSPAKTSYTCGEGVTLTPSANSGWTFTGWSGDIVSSSPTLSFNMTRAYTITANFQQGAPVDLTKKVFLPSIRR